MDGLTLFGVALVFISVAGFALTLTLSETYECGACEEAFEHPELLGPEKEPACPYCLSRNIINTKTLNLGGERGA